MSGALNIADSFLVDRLAEGNGDRIAIRHRGGVITYEEVNRLADRYAHALGVVGVRREGRVFIVLPDGPDFVAALFGILKKGAVAVMVNPGLAAERIGELVEFCRPTAAVVDDAVADRLSGPLPRLVLASGQEGGGVTVDDMSPQPFPTASTDRDDPAIWLFSGGTTGVPKAVVQTHRSFANTTRLYAQDTLGYRPDDVTMAIPKLYFGYATGSNLLFPFSVGASTVLFAEHPTPALVFDLIARHRPTILVNVPTMVAKMINHPDASTGDLSSLRFATSAGEALPAALYRRWKDTFGVELLDGLGTAEMWHIFISNRPGDVRPGTLGKPVEGFDIRVCDEEGNDVAGGEVGRLWARGDSLARGYWRDEKATAEAFRDGWFVGGDLVRRDGDGYVEHHGRAGEALKVGGKWLAPQEVESCLLQHEAVEAAAVVGVADRAGLIKPVAFVVTSQRRPGLEDELMAHSLQHLEAYKHPRRVILVDALPATHLGKVDRSKLKGMAAQDPPS
ncbi:MAG: benzoate-CoA ligase family protein [Acidimicrobiia bacterium]